MVFTCHHVDHVKAGTTLSCGEKREIGRKWDFLSKGQLDRAKMPNLGRILTSKYLKKTKRK